MQYESFQVASHEQLAAFKMKALAWANEWDVCAFFATNGHLQYKESAFEWRLAVGVERELCVEEGQALEALRRWSSERVAWRVGGLSYDTKNELEKLNSNNPDFVQMPLLYMFEPRYLLTVQADGRVEIGSEAEPPADIWARINAANAWQTQPIALGGKPVQTRLDKDSYLQTIEQIRQHIIDGDVYELNFCQEFFVDNVDLRPLDLFISLNEIAQTPFASYMRVKDKYVCCASPERYLRKAGNRIWSQPIKGTRKRGQTPELDAAIRAELAQSEKDRAENVMIVDLVRNDLARVCRAGTVQVSELCALYGFPSVWQLVSTIEGQLEAGRSWIDALAASFPMGSMTGAPKVAAMQLIEHYERSRRGWYSGAVGYVAPSGDFDFNVVIRSFLYNQTHKYLSWQVGGAIVYDSLPMEEYEECLIKIRPLLRVLGAE